jgi:hypothetical protein
VKKVRWVCDRGKKSDISAELSLYDRLVTKLGGLHNKHAVES